MKYKLIFFLISALVLIPGTFSLVAFGLRPSIDFTGGTLLELEFEQTSSDKLSNQTVKSIIEGENYEVSSVQKSGEKTVLIRMKPVSKDEVTTIKSVLAESLEEMPMEVRFETVGPTLGKELLRKTLIAVSLAAGAILAYVAWQFKDKKYGVCAILAMFHDTLILLGSFSLLGHFLGVEVDTLFVTAVLTILSFSVHDTVVVYDRIRESLKTHPQIPFDQLVNKAISETLGRSLNNSLTIIFMLVALLLLGGVTVRWFVVALLIGTAAGTYSSTFTAAPLLVVWGQLEKRFVSGAKR
jgi:preprotein translocase subunit SecF